MLNLTDTSDHKSCAGLSRREVLRIGALGLGGLTLPDLLRAREEVAAAGGSVRDVSVVLLFLQGGPSHIEFFDPKMDAPTEIRSTTGEAPRSSRESPSAAPSRSWASSPPSWRSSAPTSRATAATPTRTW